MKKITFLMALFALSIFSVQAQNEELVSKKGFKILPESGDYAIGVDFAPFINTLNFMGGTSTGPKMTLSDGLSIFGKYYNDKETAFRIKFTYNRSMETLKNYVLDESGVTNTYPQDVVLDEGKFSYAQFYLAMGIEKRRGYGRLQGYYGGELFVSTMNGMPNSPNEDYTYGNEFAASNTNPISTVNFNTGVSAGQFARKTLVERGLTFAFGARGFVGVEYFFAPKISIGGELGWGLVYAYQTEGESKIESWDPIDGEVKTETEKVAGGSILNVGTDGATNTFNGMVGLNGNINIIFHF